MLGPDVQLINTSAWDDADRARIAKSGAHVSITPHSEMRYSYALPQALDSEKQPVAAVDPRTGQVYRLIKQEVYDLVCGTLKPYGRGWDDPAIRTLELDHR